MGNDVYSAGPVDANVRHGGVMKWEWKGKEDKADKSGILAFEFAAGRTSIELPDFGEAHYLAQLIHKEIQSAERRGAASAVARYARLGDEITNNA